jgi:parallel beta-helix repeat protein
VAILVAAPPTSAGQDRYYVRQTVGDDGNDGLTPEAAWRSLSKLDDALEAGDTAYVGPGLYRDQVFLAHSGRPDAPIRIVADPHGRHTGDPPGVVLVTGADPVDEHRFVAHTAPGVYKAALPTRVAGVVEMDGAQFRYRGVIEPVRDVPYLQQVAELPGSFYWDPEAATLYVHTSDGKPPSRHELELIRRTGGVSMTGQHFVTIEGFVFRHMFDAGIVFWTGSGHGFAVNNVVWGSRQGIRVNGARHVVLTGNTLFRNENSGVYFMNESVEGSVIGNVFYGNAKGVRWSSGSDRGVAAANTSFDNFEAGISIERTNGAVLLRNRLFGNRRAQLNAHRATFYAEGNCFEPGDPERGIAELDRRRLTSLEAYRRLSGQDLASRLGRCGAPPGRIDVQALHRQSTGYPEAARRQLGVAP